MFRYEAPNPYPRSSNSCSSLFSCSSISSSSGRAMGKMVLPAQIREPQIIDQTSLLDIAEDNGMVINTGLVTTYDNAMLDTIEMMPAEEALKPISEQYFIVKFNGNGMQYQDVINRFVRDANTLDCNVIGFNYRGVGHSVKNAKEFQDLVTDGIAEVQRILDQGVDSRHITLDGISLGGGVATMVASYFHKHGQPVYLWNDRSFASISKAAAGMLAPQKAAEPSAFESSLGFSAWSIMAATGWEEQVARAYNEDIPAEFKGYMVVAKRSEHSIGDGVIDHPASLHRGVIGFEKKNGVRTGHKVLAGATLFGGGHNAAREDLISKDNGELTGQDLFEQFVMSHRR